MKTLLLTIASVFVLNTYAQSSDIQWQNIIAGNDMESPGKIIQSTNGSYFSVGATTSSIGDLAPYKGNWDAWITKIDANGNFLWKKNLGGSNADLLTSIIQTSDGNYIAAGGSGSQDGDLTGIPFNSTKFGWLVKFDNNGTVLWHKKFGGSYTETGTIIKESVNGDLHVFTTSYSNNMDVQTHYGSTSTSDISYFKFSPTGTLLFQKTFGGSEEERLGGVTETSDGGFVVVASSYSNDHDISQHVGSTGDMNAWVFKMDANNNISWEKSFWMDGYGQTYNVRELSNGHIIFSFINKYMLNNQPTDGILITLNAQGNLVRQKTIGGAKYDDITDIIEVSPNHIVLLGYTNSNDSVVTSNTANINPVWILEIDSLANINWQKTYGGTGGESAYSFFHTNDNGFVISANTRSHDMDVINPNYWNCMCTDVWLFKINPFTVGIHETQITNSFSIYPNPANDIIHFNTSTSLVNESYAIINTLGQTVLNGKLENERSTIDVQTLQAGIYFLQIGSKQMQSYKIIKNQ